MKILGIESSFDETSVAILEINENQVAVLAQVTSSQIGLHQSFGGVVPEVAARRHCQNIPAVLQQCLAATTEGDGSDLDLIAVTKGPGLMTSLAVGVQTAEALGLAWQKTVVGVNHLEGHLLSPYLEHNFYPPRAKHFPLLVLTVAGGHTQLVLVPVLGEYRIVGTTLDDAAGEAFDKVAKWLGLPYPGGPQIDRLAKNGNPQAFNFPRPLLDADNFNFSFSGLKTALRYTLKDLGVPLEKEGAVAAATLSEEKKADLAASFQRAIVDVLTQKTLLAAEKYGARTIFLAGGVAANSELQARLRQDTVDLFPDRQFLPVARQYCTDNAAMIALAGYFTWQRERKENGAPQPLIIEPKLRWPSLA